MSEKDLEIVSQKINDNYQLYFREIQHVAGHIRSDLQYATMILSGYNAKPNMLWFKDLDQTLFYLHHHPYITVMFPRTKINHTTPLAPHFGSGDTEITSIH